MLNYLLLKNNLQVSEDGFIERILAWASGGKKKEKRITLIKEISLWADQHDANQYSLWLQAEEGQKFVSASVSL